MYSRKAIKKAIYSGQARKQGLLNLLREGEKIKFLVCVRYAMLFFLHIKIKVERYKVTRAHAKFIGIENFI